MKIKIFIISCFIASVRLLRTRRT